MVSLTLQSQNSSPICDICGFILKAIITYFVQKQAHLTVHPYKMQTSTNTQKNITDTILSLSKSCIPNKFVRMRPSEPPWMTTIIKQQIRKRKRAFRRAKQTKTVVQWAIFKRIRNNVVSLIRESKQNIEEKLSTKLKSQSLSSRDWWRTLKTFFSSDSKSKIPTLDINGSLFTDNIDKANLLNDYFRDQTLINENNAF